MDDVVAPPSLGFTGNCRSCTKASIKDNIGLYWIIRLYEKTRRLDAYREDFGSFDWTKGPCLLPQVFSSVAWASQPLSCSHTRLPTSPLQALALPAPQDTGVAST